jgi:hypothetical protein
MELYQLTLRLIIKVALKLASPTRPDAENFEPKLCIKLQ